MARAGKEVACAAVSRSDQAGGAGGGGAGLQPLEAAARGAGGRGRRSGSHHGWPGRCEAALSLLPATLVHGQPERSPPLTRVPVVDRREGPRGGGALAICHLSLIHN